MIYSWRYNDVVVVTPENRQPRSHTVKKNRTLIPLFGAPFGGKQTLLDAIVDMFKVRIIGVGDICREHITQNSSIAQAALEYMEKNGTTLWPTNMLFMAINDWLMRNLTDEDQVLIGDGVLRKEDQVPEIVNLCKGNGVNRIYAVHVHTPDEECVRRSGLRPPRVGDLPIAERLRDYHEHSMPALQRLLESKLMLSETMDDLVRAEYTVVRGHKMLEDAPRFAGALATILGVKPIK